MKKIFFFFTAIIFSISFIACGINPPEVVQTAFNNKFPNAKEVSWGKENSQEYEAEFIFNEKKCSANFSVNGDWLETETEISTSELPQNIVISIYSDYKDYEIIEADKIENSKSEILFEADIKKSFSKKEVLYKTDGTKIN